MTEYAKKFYEENGFIDPFTEWESNDNTELIENNIEDFSEALAADIGKDYKLRGIVYCPDYERYITFYNRGNDEFTQDIDEKMIKNFIIRYTAYMMMKDVIKNSVNLDEWGEKRLLRMSTF